MNWWSCLSSAALSDGGLRRARKVGRWFSSSADILRILAILYFCRHALHPDLGASLPQGRQTGARGCGGRRQSGGAGKVEETAKRSRLAREPSCHFAAHQMLPWRALPAHFTLFVLLHIHMLPVAIARPALHHHLPHPVQLQRLCKPRLQRRIELGRRRDVHIH